MPTSLKKIAAKDRTHSHIDENGYEFWTNPPPPSLEGKSGYVVILGTVFAFAVLGATERAYTYWDDIAHVAQDVASKVSAVARPDF